MPHIAPSIIQKCRQWSVSMTKTHADGAEPVAEPAPALREPYPELAPVLSEMEQLAGDVRIAGAAARKITVLGTASNESITLTALTLARLVARHAQGRGGRSVGVVADASGGIGRSGRAGAD